MRGRRDRRGFTLIELLVVMAIMGVVVGAIHSLYLTHMRVSYTQDDVVDVQQNLRIAMDCLDKDLKMAGMLVPYGVNPVQNGFANYSSSLQINSSSPDRRYAKVMHASTLGAFSNYTTTVDTPMALAGFNAGDTVRIIRPYDHSLPFGNVSSLRLAAASSTSPAASFTATGGTGFPAGITVNAGDVIAKVNTPGVNSYPALLAGYNTVVYSLAAAGTGACPAGVGSCLVRQVNPPLPSLPPPAANDVVATNISELNFHYLLDDGSETGNPAGSESAIRSVRVTVVGVTTRKTDPNWVPRTRELSSIITLRNHGEMH